MTTMTAKPSPRPRPAPVSAHPGPLIPAVAVKVAYRGGVYCFHVTTGAQSWEGVLEAPNAEVAFLEVFREIRCCNAHAGGAVRALTTFGPDSCVWQYADDLAAIGCLIERPKFVDLPLMRAASAGLAEFIAREIPAVGVGEELAVATDGSVRKNCSGRGWLAADGRYGIRGQRSYSTPGSQAVLVAELTAIGDAVRSLKTSPLSILCDSKTAVAVCQRWMAGDHTLPMGSPASVGGQPNPLAAVKDVIHQNRARLSVQWVKGHSGDPLNEGADALARLASRYSRGDSGLTRTEYVSRAAGLADSFAAEFSRRRCA